MEDNVDTKPCPRCKTSRAFYSKKLEKWLCFSFTGGPLSCYPFRKEENLRPASKRRR